MKLVYLHNEKFSYQKANVVGAVSMCSAFSSLGIETTLAFRDSGMSIDELQTIVSHDFAPANKIAIQQIPASVPIMHKLDSYLYSVNCRKLIQKVEPDLCYVRDPLAGSAALRVGIPTVLESHGIYYHSNRLINKYYTRLIVRSVKKKNCPFLVTISEALRKYWIAHGIPDQKIISLHDAFSADLFKKQLDKRDSRKLLGLDLHAKIVAYTGSLYSDRGIEQIIKLANQLPQITFVVAGGPLERQQYYERNARKAGLSNIRFLGHVEHTEIPVVLSAADVLLAIWTRHVPTINYCSPLKIFEYMAAGCRIVAHGFPTISEVLVHDETAFLADPSRPESLLYHLRRALDPLKCPEMGQRARSVAFEKHTWEQRAQGVINMVTKVRELSPEAILEKRRILE